MGYTQLTLNTNNFSLTSETSSPVLNNVSNILNPSVNNTTINSFGGVVLSSAIPFLKYTFNYPQYLNKVIINFADTTGVKTGTLTFYDENDNKINNPQHGSIGTIGNFPNPGSDDDGANNEFLFTQPLINPIKVKAFEFRFSSVESAHTIGIDFIQAFIPDKLQEYRQKDYNIEFNDSILDLDGWKNPRYDGSKLIGAQINKFIFNYDKNILKRKKNITNNFDILYPYGPKPVIENKTVALFIGNNIQEGSLDTENSLVEIENHSYLNIDKIILINPNKNGSEAIEEIITRESIEDDAFNQMIIDNFPEGSKAKVRLLDREKSNNLSNSHHVKFNRGLLMKVYAYQANNNGHEDGVFGGFGTRHNQGTFTNNLASGSTPGGGLFSFGMTAVNSHSLFTSNSISMSSNLPTELSIYNDTITSINELNPISSSYIPPTVESDGYTDEEINQFPGYKQTE